MEPCLAHGDGVFVRLVQSDRPLRPGDIVVVRHPFQRGVTMVKRIESIENGRLRLLGDQPEESTDSRSLGCFDPKLVHGRVLASVPRGSA